MNRPKVHTITDELAPRILYLIAVLDDAENIVSELLVSVVDRDELIKEVDAFMSVTHENSGLFTEVEVCRTLNKVRMIIHENE